MGEHSKIAWTHHTFNPWIGCQNVSPACDHCYAETLATRRFGVKWGPHGERRLMSFDYWKQPGRWNRKARAAAERHRVFCASLADIFDNKGPVAARNNLWVEIKETPELDWLLLTKRPQNIAGMLPKDWGDGWPNVWLGTTAEDEPHYRQRWRHLADVPAALRFLSYEPALGAIGDLQLGLVGSPDWVICGGESGAGHRPMQIEWARSARDQCALAGKPFFFKQWGGRTPTAGGDELDGSTWHQVPVPLLPPAPNLRRQQMPVCEQ